ncbi:predicted protein [Pyrenophora tritici-repentis Pt-1C-BFP]|uniref:F-box domain-containing protein n=1 Tax=Pyrenophora tritici-repentis (strain Pt-1C-BFP) TaxID=426418 RepID=B2WKR7_PYRTR|nr:uncharacterized protein PTRG_10577 [Pyrenophora tritici-repentis Pt-1C-BFP]EDU43627.1 predicted protein [Pyrenophora tritici-repentis Pt-1C-BFP]
MATTGESTTVQAGKSLSFRDLPLELKEMVLDYLNNIEDVASLRLVCKDMVPWEFLWKVPYRILSMKESAKKLWQIAMTQQRFTNNGMCRNALPEHLRTIVFEAALPSRTSNIDVATDDIDLGGSCVHTIISDVFHTYHVKRHEQLCNPAMGNIISTALHNLDSIATMMYHPFHPSRLDKDPRSDQDRRNLILASKGKEAHEFANAMWMNRNITLRNHTKFTELVYLMIFHDAINAVLRNPKRKKKLRDLYASNSRGSAWRLSRNYLQWQQSYGSSVHASGSLHPKFPETWNRIALRGLERIEHQWDWLMQKYLHSYGSFRSSRLIPRLVSSPEATPFTYAAN